MENLSRNTSIRMNFNEKENEMISFLNADLGFNRPQELLRHLLTTAYKEQKDHIAKYGDGVKRKRGRPSGGEIEEDEDYIPQPIEGMSIGELHAHLVTIGYFKPNHLMESNESVILQYKVWKDEATGKICGGVDMYDRDAKKVYEYVPWFTGMDELEEDLKKFYKENKIKS